ncbi:outer membrane beta-barrel protein [Fibrobacter sp. UWB13]|uniref:outer membrane beta-barrel protein n=1 Tax=Fibrobacter sp. UWB13 TaxID=1896204 RepID=UPI000A0E8858|nr:outer membrane beta-barrel protein [Fibrobacter sp. UWB13]SMG16368.1 hypothetical protein SAMN05720489_0833 [Fibrobacter sp. UWB13]
MNRLVALLSLVVLMASAVWAGPLSTPYTHNGLFASASVGLGYASFENADGTESLIADGFGMKLHGKLGYYIVQDLALHANLGYVMYSNFREAREGLPTYVDHDFYVLSSVYLGAGVTYYIPQWNNVFLGGSLGVTGYELDCHKYAGNTGLKAFSFDVDLGKDWWVSEHLALGASIAYNYGKYWSDDDGVFSSSSVMLMFSVTLN